MTLNPCSHGLSNLGGERPQEPRQSSCQVNVESGLRFICKELSTRGSGKARGGGGSLSCAVRKTGADCGLEPWLCLLLAMGHEKVT